MSTFLKARRVVLAGLVGIAAALLPGMPAQAAIPGDNWYMIVNDYYDGTSDHDDDYAWCLSTNEQAPAGGSGTHLVYLARCNSAAPAQWWRLRSTGNRVDPSERELVNYQNFDNIIWTLSANDRWQAYTARHRSSTAGQKWKVVESDEGGSWRLISYVGGWLSTTHNSPYPAGTFQVYQAGPTAKPYPAQNFWRFRRGTTVQPPCTPCGRLPG